MLMNSIRNDPKCGDGSAVGDMVKIIQEKMLIIALPQGPARPLPGFRSNAADVATELARIIERAKSEPSYLFNSDSPQNIPFDPRTEAVQPSSLPPNPLFLLPLMAKKDRLASPPPPPLCPM